MTYTKESIQINLHLRTALFCNLKSHVKGEKNNSRAIKKKKLET